jgi:transcriptional regulator with XRE-family HTH domain
MKVKYLLSKSTIKRGKMAEIDVFPERLKSAREMRKLTQNELGQRANLPATSIAHFEAGSRKPSFDNLRKLAVALGITIDYLLGREVESSVVEDTTNGDTLFRDIKKLSAQDLELAKQFLKILADRNN